MIGEYIKTFHDTGCFGIEPFYARILRVNRVSVTVKDENGRVTRVSKQFVLLHLIDTEDWHPEIEV